jgi:glycosyltransferase involved in cell wall biosynthesis
MTPHKRTVMMAGPLPPAIGGMTSVVCDLAESALRDAFELRLFDTGKRTPARRSLATAVSTRFGLWRQWWSLLRQTKAIGAHIHTCSGLTFFLDGALLLLARLQGVPVLLHIHGGRFAQFLDELNPVGAAVARWIARRATRVVVLSESWRERLASRLPGASFAVVENGVPVPRELPQRPDPPPFVVLFLGTVCHDKGVEDLIRAAADHRDRARFVLVGPQDDRAFVARMRSLVAELGLVESVEFAGPAQGERKHEWLARAHVFVLPSRVEAFPVSILEAMAAGLPIVATAVGAVPTMIESGRSGLLVTAGDVASLSSAISNMLSDRTLRARLAASARTECIQRFSIERTAGVLRGLYAEVMNS